jgi:hypothetical protein
MKVKTRIITLLAVLAVLGSLMAIAAVPASAQDGNGFTLPSNPGCAVVGQSVSVSATWTPNTIITAELDGVDMITSPPVVNTGDEGTVTFAVKIPATTAGNHNFTVTDGVDTVSYYDMTENYFMVSPKVVISDPASKKGIVGSSITIVGTGFSAGVTADVYMDDYNPVALDVPISASGGFTVVGTVPQKMGPGSHEIWAQDGAGYYSEEGEGSCGVPDYFTVQPTLTISTPSGLAGTDVTLRGTGWCEEDNVEVWFAGEYYDTYPVTDSSINITMTIPTVWDDTPVTPGTKQIKVVCESDSTVYQVVNFVVVARPLTISPTNGPRGTMVTVTGTNMTPKEEIAADDLWINGSEWNTGDLYPVGGGHYPGDIPISSGGVIQPTILPIPDFALVGNNLVQAWDTGDPTLEADGVFVVKQPTISVSPVTGPRGSTIVITGAGWVPGAKVTVAFNDGAEELDDVTPTPDATGAFAASMTVPDVGGAGAYTITAEDGWNNQAQSKAFTVPGPAITITPTSGAPLTTVTVSGTGFMGYSVIDVTFQDFPEGHAITDALGAFIGFTFSAPGLGPGIKVVQAIDQADQTANAFFTLSAAPVTISTQVASCSSVIVRIWGYGNGTWYLYDPADTAGSDLTTLTSGMGYWINASAACTLVYGAYSYALSAGWTLIGWR